MHSESNGKIKLNFRDAVMVVLIIFGIGAAWATLIAGQNNLGQRLGRIELHAASIDSVLTSTSRYYISREEIIALKHVADEQHKILQMEIDILQDALNKKQDVSKIYGR